MVKLILILTQIFILSIYTSCSNMTKTEGKKCFVLALQGGGDKGAYQAGVLKGLVENVPYNETQWDVVTGISVGSINALGLGIYDIGNEVVATNDLIKFWRELKGYSDIFQNWWAGPLNGLFFKSGLFDNSPLRSLLESKLEGNVLKRKFICGATNFNTGAYDTFDDESLTHDEIQTAVTASASVPVIFPMTEFRGSSYIDGGIKMSLDISSGINKCLDMDNREEDIVVDVVLTAPLSGLPQENSTGVSSLGVLFRFMSILSHSNALNDIEFIKKSFPKVNYRYAVAPKTSLPSSTAPITFRPEEIEEMIQYGIEDAKNAVALGEGKSLEIIMMNFNQQRKVNLGRRPLTQNVKQNNVNNLVEEVEFLK